MYVSRYTEMISGVYIKLGDSELTVEFIHLDVIFCSVTMPDFVSEPGHTRGNQVSVLLRGILC